MKCDFQGEMVFPLPFSILTVIFALGLGIARFMKNQTRFYVTLLAFTDTIIIQVTFQSQMNLSISCDLFNCNAIKIINFLVTDIVLRFNWVFLLIYLYIGDFLVSASIIAYCLLFGTLSNFVIWRLAFYRSGLDTDKEYNRYTLRYPFTSKFLLFTSFVFSFHIFRFSYSRLLGKKQFSAGFQNFSSFVRLMSGMTIFNLVFNNNTIYNLKFQIEIGFHSHYKKIMFICLPAVFANAYNLAYAKQSQQVFYLDLDGLILVCFECVMVGFVIKQGEKVAMGSDLFKSLVGAKSEQMSEEQQKIDEQQLLKINFISRGQHQIFKDKRNQENQKSDYKAFSLFNLNY